jgi:hypothetical protein
MKDLRIEIARLAKVIVKKTDDYGSMYRDTKKNYVGNHGAFKVVATDISDYDGMEVTVCISSHKTWTAAEKALKAKAQDLSFDERAKAFDRMIAEREEGHAIQVGMKAELEAIKKAEAIEMKRRVDFLDRREGAFKHKLNGESFKRKRKRAK